MPEYRVVISEEFVHRIAVEASSEQEAIDKAYDLVGNTSGDVLKAENDYEFEAVGFLDCEAEEVA